MTKESKKLPRKMKGVREHAEGFDVELVYSKGDRLAIRAYNEGGSNCTEVDFLDLIEWLKDEGLI